MRIGSMALLLIAAAHCAAAQDDYKVMKLEQDMRNLERQVQELSRQLGDAQRQIAQLGGRPVTRTDRSTPATVDTSTRWLDVRNWDRLREGMTELQVIELLGPPTSMRAEGDARTLFYAMEIGSNGFLSGTVRLDGRKVDDVQKPTLR
jgi:hypothetical protein